MPAEFWGACVGLACALALVLWDRPRKAEFW
jgi:hypothetical protein